MPKLAKAQCVEFALCWPRPKFTLTAPVKQRQLQKIEEFYVSISRHKIKVGITYLLFYLLTYLLTYLLIYLLTYLLTYPLTSLLISFPRYLLTYFEI